MDSRPKSEKPADIASSTGEWAPYLRQEREQLEEGGRPRSWAVKAWKRIAKRREAAVAAIERKSRIWAHAVAVFGDEQKASHWLITPLPLLDGQSPARILAQGDVDRVDAILTRIEHNIPS